MGKNELAWQTKMVKAIQAAGGYAQKTAHRTKVGVPDLLIKMPEKPAALIEVKHVVLDRGTQIVNINLTRPQALHCKSFTKAGGRAFWLAVLTYSYKREVRILVSENMEDLKWTVERATALSTPIGLGQFQTDFLKVVQRI